MQATDVLRGLGLFVEEGVLDLDLCARIRSEMSSVGQTPAEIRYEGGKELDRSFRSTGLANVSRKTVETVHERFSALQPRLREHFGFRPGPCEEPQFLRYTEGDFFRPHRDNSLLKHRRLSLVVFLNDQGEQPQSHTYSGGALVFYGLIADPRAENIGLPLAGKAGIGVAFRPEVVHEVEPVTHGERSSIVTWYH